MPEKDITQTGAVGLKGVRNEDLYSSEPSALDSITAQILQRRKEYTTNNYGSPTDPSVLQFTPVASDDPMNILGKSKYDEPRIGQNAEDIQNNRAAQQSWFTKLGAGVLKGAALTGTTLADGTLGLVTGTALMFKAAVDGEDRKSVIAKLWDNDISNSLRKFNEYLDNEALPNYYSTEEQNRAWYKNLGTMNFWADSFIKNMGFTVGAYLSGGAWTKGLKAVGAMSSAMGAQVTGSLLSAVNEARTEANQNVADFKELEKAQILEAYNNALTEIREPADYSKIRENRDKALAELEDRANKMGIAIFVGNTALLSLDNFKTVGKLYGRGFKNYERSLNLVKDTELSDRITKDATGKLVFNQITAKEAAAAAVKTGFLEGHEEIAQGFIADVAGNWNKPYESPDDYLNAMYDVEAAKRSSDFLGDVVKSLANTYGNMDRYEEFAVGFLTGILGVPTFGVTANTEASTYLGKGKFVGLSGGAGGEFSKRAQMNREGAETVTALNKALDELNEHKKNFARSEAFTNAMKGYAQDKDKFMFKNAEDNEFFTLLTNFVKAGKLDMFRSLIDQDFENISDEDLEKIALYTTKKDGITGWKNEDGSYMYETEEGKDKMRKELAEKRDEMKKMADDYVDCLAEIRSRGYHSFNTEEETNLAWLLWKTRRLSDRFISMRDTNKGKVEEVKAITSELAKALQAEYEASNSEEDAAWASGNLSYADYDETSSRIKENRDLYKQVALYDDLLQHYLTDSRDAFAQYIFQSQEHYDAIKSLITDQQFYDDFLKGGIASPTGVLAVQEAIVDSIRAIKTIQDFNVTLKEYYENPEKFRNKVAKKDADAKKQQEAQKKEKRKEENEKRTISEMANSSLTDDELQHLTEIDDVFNMLEGEESPAQSVSGTQNVNQDTDFADVSEVMGNPGPEAAPTEVYDNTESSVTGNDVAAASEAQSLMEAQQKGEIAAGQIQTTNVRTFTNTNQAAVRLRQIVSALNEAVDNSYSDGELFIDPELPSIVKTVIETASNSFTSPASSDNPVVVDSMFDINFEPYINIENYPGNTRTEKEQNMSEVLAVLPSIFERAQEILNRKLSETTNASPVTETPDGPGKDNSGQVKGVNPEPDRPKKVINSNTIATNLLNKQWNKMSSMSKETKGAIKNALVKVLDNIIDQYNNGVSLEDSIPVVSSTQAYQVIANNLNDPQFADFFQDLNQFVDTLYSKPQSEIDKDYNRIWRNSTEYTEDAVNAEFDAVDKAIKADPASADNHVFPKENNKFLVWRSSVTAAVINPNDKSLIGTPYYQTSEGKEYLDSVGLYQRTEAVWEYLKSKGAFSASKLAKFSKDAIVKYMIDPALNDKAGEVVILYVLEETGKDGKVMQQVIGDVPSTKDARSMNSYKDVLDFTRKVLADYENADHTVMYVVPDTVSDVYDYFIGSVPFDYQKDPELNNRVVRVNHTLNELYKLSENDNWNDRKTEPVIVIGVHGSDGNVELFNGPQSKAVQVRSPRAFKAGMPYITIPTGIRDEKGQLGHIPVPVLCPHYDASFEGSLFDDAVSEAIEGIQDWQTLSDSDKRKAYGRLASLIQFPLKNTNKASLVIETESEVKNFNPNKTVIRTFGNSETQDIMISVIENGKKTLICTVNPNDEDFVNKVKKAIREKNYPVQISLNYVNSTIKIRGKQYRYNRVLGQFIKTNLKTLDPNVGYPEIIGSWVGIKIPDFKKDIPSSEGSNAGAGEHAAPPQTGPSDIVHGIIAFNSEYTLIYNALPDIFKDQLNSIKRRQTVIKKLDTVKQRIPISSMQGNYDLSDKQSVLEDIFGKPAQPITINHTEVPSAPIAPIEGIPMDLPQNPNEGSITVIRSFPASDAPTAEVSADHYDYNTSEPYGEALRAKFTEEQWNKMSKAEKDSEIACL